MATVPGNWAWKLTATSGNSSNSENSEVEGNYSSGTVGDIESDDRCNKLQRHPQSHRRKSRKIQRHSTGDNSCSSPELTQKQKPNKYLYSGRAHHTEARDSHSTTLVKGFQATQSCNNSDHSEPELYQPQQEDVRYECEQLRREVMRLKQENDALKMQLKICNRNSSVPPAADTVTQHNHSSNYNDLL